MPVPVVSAILTNTQGEVLMQLRDDTPGLAFANCWTLPGGLVERGESPDEAIKRELLEEIEADMPLDYLGSHRARRGPLKLVVVEQHLFAGRIDRPAEDIPLHEGQALRYVTAADLALLPIAFDHGATLEKFFAERREA